MAIQTIVFDFDGTVTVGNGPVLAYAHVLSRSIGSTAATLEKRVAEQLDTAPGRICAVDAPLDGYDVVRRLSMELGATTEQLDHAYQMSRTLLGTTAAPIEAPLGLAAFLAELAPLANLVLVTNSPATNLQESLHALGLHRYFAQVIHSAGKPAGMRAIASEWLVFGRLLSVGDIWENDLEPVAELGGATALIGTPPARADPTFFASTLPELYGEIRRWALAEQLSD